MNNINNTNNNGTNNENLVYPLDDIIVYQTKHKVNPFDIPVDYVESPLIPTSMFSKENEKWARLPKEAIPGLTDDILVSDHGKVYNNTKDIMISQYENTQGYKRCKLPTVDGETDRGVHKLIMLTFDPIPDPANTKLIPNHVNGKPADNYFDNLEWATHRYNNEHALMSNLTNTKLSVEDVKDICELLETGKYTSKEIAENYDCNDSNIRNIKSGTNWKFVSKKYNIKTNPRLEDEVIVKICEMLETKKYTDVQIAKECGVSDGYVNDIRHGRRRTDISRNYDIDSSNHKDGEEAVIRKICEMIVENKYSDSEIAEACGVTRACVYNIATGKNRRDISKDYFTEYKTYNTKKPITNDQIKEATKLIKMNKFSENQIASMTGMSRSSVNKLKRNIRG